MLRLSYIFDEFDVQLLYCVHTIYITISFCILIFLRYDKSFLLFICFFVVRTVHIKVSFVRVYRLSIERQWLFASGIYHDQQHYLGFGLQAFFSDLRLVRWSADIIPYSVCCKDTSAPTSPFMFLFS